MADVYRFKFDEGIDKKFIKNQIALAVITAECTFGPLKVKLNATYLVSKNKVIIDISNDVGAHIAQVFTGLITRQIGEDKFIVERMKDKI